LPKNRTRIQEHSEQIYENKEQHEIIRNFQTSQDCKYNKFQSVQEFPICIQDQVPCSVQKITNDVVKDQESFYEQTKGDVKKI
jgi:hypothetical protein